MSPNGTIISMYIYYQHYKDAVTGSVTMTELKMSSNVTSWFTNTKDAREKAMMQFILTSLKFPPSDKRTMSKDYIWTFFDDWGVKALKMAEESTKALGGITLVEVEDLAYLVSQMRFDVNKKRVTVDPKDFFYEQAPATGSNEPTKEQVAQKLAQLFQLPSAADMAKAAPTELKKLYRFAALRLHPDRNNGDGAGMSELNYLWRIYNS